ncbi:hypothetical protein PUN28_018839 [Cardiocondyla obscurior]|uniref:Uncharacterized protein n=1 Tax=Cardiocondyla obscurior TaxID=286306 RepID=A0AAW2EHQ9_9HYME
MVILGISGIRQLVEYVFYLDLLSIDFSPELIFSLIRNRLAERRKFNVNNRTIGATL